MQEIILSEGECVRAATGAAGEALPMDEESFRTFYNRTARPLWAYLSRISEDTSVADDLLQECYYRFLRAGLPEMDEAHRKNYLFRIAANLLHDHWRRGKENCILPPERPAVGRGSERVEQESDLRRAFAHLKPRERELLWLAYVEGFSHREIGELVGLKAGSIRPLLFRARQRLAGLLRAGGLAGAEGG